MLYCTDIPKFLICSSFLKLSQPTVIVCSAEIVSQNIMISATDVLVCIFHNLTKGAVIQRGTAVTVGFVDEMINATVC